MLGMRLYIRLCSLVIFVFLAATNVKAYTAVAQTRDAKVIGVAQHKNKIEAKKLAVQMCLKNPKVQGTLKVCDDRVIAYPNSYVQLYKSDDGRVHIGLGKSRGLERGDAINNCHNNKGKMCTFFSGYNPSHFQRWRFSKKTSCWMSSHGKTWCPHESQL